MPRDRIKEIRSVRASELIANEQNFRVHTDAQREAMTGILEEVGNVDVLKAIETEQGLKLIDGHLRRDLLADETVQVAVLDLTEEEARKVLLTFDRLGALATIDTDAVGALLANTVLDDARLNAMLAAWRDEIVIPEETDIGDDPGGDVPGNPDDAVSRRGDVWVMGNHRTMCGDSSSPDDLDTLLAFIPVDLVNTDPPYNVKVEPRSNNAIAAGLSSFPMQDRKGDTRKKGDDHHQQLDLARHPEKAKATHKKLRPKDRPLENDFVTDAAFDTLLESWFGNIARVLKKGGSFYIWGGYANCANYPPVLIKHKLYFAQAIIWIKEHPVLTRKDFMGNHEWCFYGWREGSGHKFYGAANVTDTWSVKKVNPQSMIHLTEKPVELAKRAIEYSSKHGDTVLDLFGGSGSTLIGAELTGRHARLMEIDTLYADVIVERWQTMTEKEATLEATGQTFAEVRAERTESKQ